MQAKVKGQAGVVLCVLGQGRRHFKVPELYLHCFDRQIEPENL